MASRTLSACPIPIQDIEAMLVALVPRDSAIMPPGGWRRRLDAVLCRAAGMTLSRCGEELGVGAARAQQLVSDFQKRARRRSGPRLAAYCRRWRQNG